LNFDLGFINSIKIQLNTIYSAGKEKAPQLMVFSGQKTRSLSLCKKGIFPILFALEI